MTRRPVGTVKKGDRFVGKYGLGEDGPYTAASDADEDFGIVVINSDDGRALGFKAHEWVTDWSA
jgi:hypothetical protein